MRVHKIEIPKIPEEEKTPIILQLLEIIEQQSETIILQAEEIQQLNPSLAKPIFIPNKLLISLKNKACFLHYKNRKNLIVWLMHRGKRAFRLLRVSRAYSALPPLASEKPPCPYF